MTNTIKIFKNLIIIFFFLISCKKEDSRYDGPWITNQIDNFILNTRPVNYSSSKSPDSVVIKTILDNHIIFQDEINSKLNVDFHLNVEIFLFNYDEALAKIGTNGGGGAEITKNRIYYSFFGKIIYDTIINRELYIGSHELVHIITFNELGLHKTRLMCEGYACAIDARYGTTNGEHGEYIAKPNDLYIKEYKESNQILSPEKLLNGEDLPAELFYPQAGFFVNWLFNNYSVEKINQLYTIDKDNFKNQFFKVTGIEFCEMESMYLEYINKLDYE